MKGRPIMELAGSGVIESEEGEEEANLTGRQFKCEIGSSHMEFVGHEIKEGEIGLQNDNVKKIQEALGLIQKLRLDLS